MGANIEEPHFPKKDPLVADAGIVLTEDMLGGRVGAGDAAGVAYESRPFGKTTL